jgi:hypothetical protein
MRAGIVLSQRVSSVFMMRAPLAALPSAAGPSTAVACKTPGEAWTALDYSYKSVSGGWRVHDLATLVCLSTS